MVKAKKRQLSDLAQRKRLEQSKKKLNPFEVHINRDKQNVLGRRGKADKGLPGVSRAKAIDKRKRTLLQEYKLKNKDNVFLDKRIGERDKSMTDEEKAMARFAAERIKAHKRKNIFNLNEDEVLTHRGQTLEEIEKFDDPKSDDEHSDDENRTGKLGNKFVGEAHFGGGTLTRADSAKSRKDLIEQLIAESKKRKAEKQKIREETMDLTEKLDSEWRDLLPVVAASNKALEEAQQTARPDDYDMAVRELKFEARGVPTDKLKSEEEIVREEKERLEALEADRLARMKGFVKESENEVRHKSADDLDDGFAVERIQEEAEKEEEEEGAEDTDQGSDSETDDEADSEENCIGDKEPDRKKEIKAGKSEPIAKTDSVKSGAKKGKASVKDKVENGEEEEEEEEAEEEEGEGEESDSEGSDQDNLSDLKETESSSEDESEPAKKTVRFNTEAAAKTVNGFNGAEPKSILKSKAQDQVEKKEDARNEEERQKKIREDLLRRKEIMEQARKELPYTFKIPESFEDACKLLEGRSPEYQSVIVDRIIKCNHWTLDGRNKEKLSNLLLYLLQHLNNCAVEDSAESVVNCFNVLDRLSPYLYDLAQVIPENTRTFFQEIIKEKHNEFERNKRKYPGLDTLVFLKLVSLIFPTSDFRHCVVTPCFVFMSQILIRARARSRVDISKGLFVCALLLEYTALNKRFAPSVVNFLRGLLYTATPKHLVQGVRTIPPFRTLGESSNLLLVDTETEPGLDLDRAQMWPEDLVEHEPTNEFKVRALATALRMLAEVRSNMDQLEAVYAILEPVHRLLKANRFEKYPVTVRQRARKLTEDLEELAARKLKHLVLEKKRPRPLRMYEPRIEVVYDGKRQKPMSREKAEREKLLHKYKREMKGAVREIRRDRAFLAKVKIKQQIKSDTERKRKVKEIFGEAAVQQSELKKMKRKK